MATTLSLLNVTNRPVEGWCAERADHDGRELHTLTDACPTAVTDAALTAHLMATAIERDNAAAAPPGYVSPEARYVTQHRPY
jgi:hypothetical protein